MNVKELRELLGRDVLLLGWPLRSKGTLRKWGHLTVASMTPAYLEKLELGNIGVALGKVSGNLVALDLDDHALIEPFLRLNPFLNDTLQTHGARGMVFWLRMAGDYPAKTVKLKTYSGADAGEWRAGHNSQSIIHGIHPNGNPYQVVKMAKPQVVDFTSIVWPEEVKNTPHVDSQLHSVIQRDGDTEIQRHIDTDDTDDKEVVCVRGVLVQSVDHAVQLALPSKVHQNNDLLFKLARAVKALEKQSGNFTPAQLRDVFNRWYALATDYLRPEQSHDEYMTDFMDKYATAKIPLGDGVIPQAWKLAQEKPLPPEAIENFQDPKIRLIVALCWELQHIAGQEPFFLSARTVQHLLKQESHATAARWLRSFCVLKILTEIEKGGGVRASRYRFNFKENKSF